MTAAAVFPMPELPGAGFAAFVQYIINQLADAITDRVIRRLAEINKPRLTPRWLDLDDAAELMHTSRDAVRGMARAKLFPVRKMGGRVMIDIKDLERAFDESKVWLG